MFSGGGPTKSDDERRRRKKHRQQRAAHDVANNNDGDSGSETESDDNHHHHQRHGGGDKSRHQQHRHNRKHHHRSAATSTAGSSSKRHGGDAMRGGFPSRYDAVAEMNDTSTGPTALQDVENGAGGDDNGGLAAAHYDGGVPLLSVMNGKRVAATVGLPSHGGYALHKVVVTIRDSRDNSLHDYEFTLEDSDDIVTCAEKLAASLTDPSNSREQKQQILQFVQSGEWQSMLKSNNPTQTLEAQRIISAAIKSTVIATSPAPVVAPAAANPSALGGSILLNPKVRSTSLLVAPAAPRPAVAASSSPITTTTAQPSQALRLINELTARRHSTAAPIVMTPGTTSADDDEDASLLRQPVGAPSEL